MTQPEQLPPLDSWEQLARLNARPYCLPQWGLSWWNSLAPPGSQFRLVVCKSGPDVTGIAPFFVTSSKAGLVRCGLLGQDLALPVEPLAHPRFVQEVTAGFAAALSELEPRPDIVTFCGLSDSSWPHRLARSWPDGPEPLVHQDYVRHAPAIGRLEGDLATWLDTRSTNFRQQIRRNKRRLEELGASVDRARVKQDIDGQLEHFFRLHHGRWDARGGSGVLTESVEAMLTGAAPQLLERDSLRLWYMRVGEEVISSHLFIRAGGTLSYWLGGFDDRWAKYQPAQVTLLAAIEGALQEGDQTVDLGYGEQPYKSRFADTSVTLTWSTLVPRGSGYWRRRVVVAPRWARRSLSERVPQEVKRHLTQALKSLRRRTR